MLLKCFIGLGGCVCSAVCVVLLQGWLRVVRPGWRRRDAVPALEPGAVLSLLPPLSAWPPVTRHAARLGCPTEGRMKAWMRSRATTALHTIESSVMGSPTLMQSIATNQAASFKCAANLVWASSTPSPAYGPQRPWLHDISEAERPILRSGCGRAFRLKGVFPTTTRP